MTEAALSIVDLGVDAGTSAIVGGIALEARRGETLAIVGESGSGKTTVALAALGHAQPRTAIVSGAVDVVGAAVLELDPAQLRRVRGRRIAYVPQDPGSALTPSMRVGRQLREVLAAHRLEDDGAARIDAACRAAQFPRAGGELARYPHQLSGGQRQRLAIAMALVGDPDVVVMDEPTTGLDVTTQAQLLATIRALAVERDVAVVWITHDLGVVRHVADRVVVMEAGRIVERAGVAQLFAAPRSAHTRTLLEAVPRLASVADTPPAPAAAPMGEALLEVEGLTASYARGTAAVVDGVGFSVPSGGCVAVVGESGSGKTTLLRCLAGVHRHAGGQLRLGSESLRADGRRRSRLSRRRIQLIPQNPDLSLNPQRTVVEIVGRPLRQFEGLRGRAQHDAVVALLEQVRLDPALGTRFPRALSGGQKQRVAIARALAARPQLLLCDEVTSSLDVSVQASVLALLARLRDELGMAIVFVSHDLAVVSRISDRVVVLRDGRVCESGATAAVLTAPASDHTRALLDAVPRIEELDR